MDGKYFVVSNHNIISYIKSTSKYFKVNLGLSITVENDRGEDRLDNDKDRFAFAYRKYKGTTCLSSGEVGKMHFYTDFSIHTNKLIVFKDFEEFELPYDTDFIKEKGTDAWIGKMMREIDLKLEEMNSSQVKDQTNVEKPKNTGDPSKVLTNPGQVRYEDLKSYLANKRPKI